MQSLLKQNYRIKMFEVRLPKPGSIVVLFGRVVFGGEGGERKVVKYNKRRKQA